MPPPRKHYYTVLLDRSRVGVFFVFMVDGLGLDSRADYALGQSRL